jgi:hypothetical protein
VDGQAVKDIVNLARESQIIDKDGLTFSPQRFQPVKYIPKPESLTSHTLIGLVDYLKSNVDQLVLDELMILIEDHTKAVLVGSLGDEDFERLQFFSSALDSKLPSFQFDTYMGIEEFIIKSKALFQRNDTLDELISFVSKVAQQDSIDMQDDGVSQTVAVRKGVSGALTKDETTKGMYTLKPYRTFRHIDQPETTFILRLKAGDDKIPKVALFDADGGAWRDAAIQAIKVHLVSALEGAEIAIPVIS